jgi:hypothetical protein
MRFAWTPKTRDSCRAVLVSSTSPPLLRRDPKSTLRRSSLSRWRPVHRGAATCLPCPWAPLQSMTAAASPCHLCRTRNPTRAESDGGSDSLQRTRLTAARELVPVRRALPPRRALRSDRSPPGDGQPGEHEPRRRTRPRLTHPRPLPGGPKPVDVASPGVTPRDRTRRPEQPPTMPRSRRPVLQRRSVMIRSRASPASPTEAGSAGRRTEAQQAGHPYTLDTGSRCPSAAETTSGHESHLAPPRGRSELSRTLQPKLEDALASV